MITSLVIVIAVAWVALLVWALLPTRVTLPDRVSDAWLDVHTREGR